MRRGLFSMEAFIAWEIRRLYVLDVPDCTLLRAVTLHGAVLTLGMYPSNADAQRDLQSLRLLLPKGNDHGRE